MALFKPDEKRVEGSSAAAVAENAPQVSQTKARPRAFSIGGLIDSFLALLSAVPFGIFLLVLLISACMIGMLIQQVELQTFPKYFAELTPSEKLIYGRLGFFDIYHVWYFNLLLLLLSLNIILASIDHFPKAWSFVRKKKLTASPTFAMTQRFREQVLMLGFDRAELSKRAQEAAKALKFKIRTTDETDRTTIFAERGAWNRLGAYAVHVGLLTIFAGGFLTSRGHTGGVWMEPGETNDRMTKQVFNFEGASTQFAIGNQDLELPFSLECLDIQQKLINKDGGIETPNTLDWLTRVRIRDNENGQQEEALVHMNKPFDYRGYRFFQASVTEFGSARSVRLRAIPAAGGTAEEITIPRGGEARLSDGTRVVYREFNPDFRVGPDRTIDSGPGVTSYARPAAHLDVIRPNGERGDSWAFTEAVTETLTQQTANAPFLQSMLAAGGGYRFVLLDFEKVAKAHMLSVQYDPGVKVVYVGFTLLCMTLIGVFFFSHQRMWIVVEDGRVSLGGDSNRNRLGFEERLKRIAARIRDPHKREEVDNTLRD